VKQEGETMTIALFIVAWVSGFMLGREAARRKFWWPFDEHGNWPATP
jgi:hypothetical protein